MGAVESITPVYRADSSAERIVRTTSGNIYPSAYKECTVSTTLGAPSRVMVESIPLPLLWIAVVTTGLTIQQNTTVIPMLDITTIVTHILDGQGKAIA